MSWELVRLDAVCEIVGGTTPRTNNPDYWNGDIVWLSPVDLPEIGTITSVMDSGRKITELAVKESGLRILPVNTVVFSTRASIGKIGIVETPLTTNQGFNSLIPSNKVDSLFLAYALKSNIENISQLGNSTTFKEVSRSSFKEFKIPLPTLSTQKRIAEILDTADALRRKDKELLSKYDELAQAIFIDMFGDPVRNEKGLQLRKLSELAKRIVVGHVGPTSEGYTNQGIPFLRTQNVRKGYINFENINFITPEFNKHLNKSVLNSGDVVISRVGVNRGMAAVIPKDLDGANCANIIIVGRSDGILPEYLSFYLNYTFGVSSKFGYSVGSAQGVVNTSMVKDWQIINPPIELQQIFSRKLVLLQQSILKVEMNSTNSDKLFKSLLRKAFKGELIA